jgi:hypothetical protein
MRHVAKRIFFPLFVCCCIHSAPASACAVLTPEQAAEQRQRAIEEFKAKATAMKEEADLVFAGYLSRLTFHTEETTSASGQHQVLQKHQAVFDTVDDIKGHYEKGQVLEFTTIKNQVRIGCTPEFMQVPQENGVGERYLVYVRDGKIIRTNRQPMDTQVLNGHQEAAFLRGYQQ